MEANLAKLEEKLDSMLAQFEGQEAAASDVLNKKSVASEKDKEDEKKV
jgi:hypothetical protein